MKWVADENVLEVIVDWMRQRGEDVTLARDVRVGQPDAVILAFAEENGRIVLTDDKDFGALVFRQRCVTAGVLLLRQYGDSTSARLQRLEQVWPAIQASLPGRFVVVTPADVRVRELPPNAE